MSATTTSPATTTATVASQTMTTPAAAAPGTTTATTTTPSRAPSPAPTLSPANGMTLVFAVIAGMLLAGLVVGWARGVLNNDATPPGTGSVVRSWIAVSVVMGLLVFCAAAFLIDDSSLRSTLFGGLTTSVGAAVAFYFSSKTSDQARADVLSVIGNGTSPTKFTSSPPLPGTVGMPYRFQFVADGQPAATYAATGDVPPGLSLDPGGTLSGEPVRAGTYAFTVVAINSAGSISSDHSLIVS
jgi:hypothetical protein